MQKNEKIKIQKIEWQIWRTAFKKIYDEIIIMDESQVNEDYFQEFERGLMQRVGNFMWDENFLEKTQK